MSDFENERREGKTERLKQKNSQTIVFECIMKHILTKVISKWALTFKRVRKIFPHDWSFSSKREAREITYGKINLRRGFSLISFLFFSHLCNFYFCAIFMRTTRRRRKKNGKRKLFINFVVFLLFRAVHRCL